MPFPPLKDSTPFKQAGSKVGVAKARDVIGVLEHFTSFLFPDVSMLLDLPSPRFLIDGTCEEGAMPMAIRICL